MPRAVYRDGESTWDKMFPAPKRADLRGWWNAVRRAMPQSGLGYYMGQKAEVTRESIVWRLGEREVLVIDRRQG